MKNSKNNQNRMREEWEVHILLRLAECAADYICISDSVMFLPRIFILSTESADCR